MGEKRMFLCLTVLFFLASGIQAELTYYAPFESSYVMEEQTESVSETFEGTPRYRQGIRKQSLAMANNNPEQLRYFFKKPFFNQQGVFEIWIQPLSWKGTDREMPFYIEFKVNANSYVQIFKDSKSSNMIFVYGTTNEKIIQFLPVYEWKQGTWKHILVNMQSWNIRFYIDGQEAAHYKKKAEIPPVQNIADNEPSLIIAAYKTTLLDELRIYNTSFEQDIIKERFVSGYLKEKGYSNPTVRIPFIVMPPENNTGEDEKWETAALITDFVEVSKAVKVNRQTWIYAMYDDKYLYIMYKSPVPEHGLSGGPRGRDVLNGGDEIEFFVMPEYTEVFDFYQFIGNPWESVFDSQGRNAPSWNGEWSYRCKVDDKWWLAEIRMPYSAIGAETPETNTFWLANFCRNWERIEKERWTQWSYTAGAYHNFSGFGKIVFGGRETVIPRVKTAAEIDTAKKTVSAFFELENISSASKTLRMQYDFYPTGDFHPVSSVLEDVTLGNSEKKEIVMQHDLKELQDGMAEIKLVDRDSGNIYWHQMFNVKIPE